MEIPIPGAVYRHKNSGKLYLCEGSLPLKLDGRWVENGVTIYVSDETRNTYARLTPDFLASFEFLHES